jgi:hypothetical protein
LSAGVLRALAAGLALAAACGPTLPEPDAPGAAVLQQRCGGCHGLYAPGSMTFEMWKVQLARMHRLYAEQGLRWLTAAEEQALLDYLRRHAGTS